MCCRETEVKGKVFMKIKMYSIRDRKIASFGNPMFGLHHGGMIRSFSDEVNRVDDKNDLNKHSEDFDLYFLGEFDTDNGMFSTVVPEQIAIGNDVLIPKV